MLLHLSVRDLAIIHRAEVDFSPGLNVITGETGAGKSLLTDALGLLTGGRADRTLIREGAKEIALQALIQLPAALNEAVGVILEEAGIPPCEEGELLLRRLIPSGSTGGRCYVNDHLTTLQTLRRLGSLLVDLHGPYDHQSLASNETQRAILDAVANLSTTSAPLSTYRAARAEMASIDAELSALQGEGNAREEEFALLRDTLEELEGANLSLADGDELIRRHTQAANAQDIIRLGAEINRSLLEGEQPIYDQLVQVNHALTALAALYPPAKEWSDELDSIAIQTQELAAEIASSLREAECDPELFAQLEDRLALVQRLKRKYRTDLPGLLDKLERTRERLGALEGRGGRIAELERQRSEALLKMEAESRKLTALRQKTAKRLGPQITRALRDLGFLQADFAIGVEPAPPGPFGGDRVIYRFAPNPGEGAKPLQSIASSGETARVMLAVQAVLANYDAIPILVFDEIDSNVGGETGAAVGRNLRAAAAGRQVISITHLPQSAVYGATHLHAGKRVVDGRTCAEFTRLDDAARRLEIARMLGDAQSETAQAHAVDLLSRAQAEQ